MIVELVTYISVITVPLGPLPKSTQHVWFVSIVASKKTQLNRPLVKTTEYFQSDQCVTERYNSYSLFYGT